MEVLEKESDYVTIKMGINELFSIHIMVLLYEDYLKSYVSAKPENNVEIMKLMKEFRDLQHEYKMKILNGEIPRPKREKSS